MTEQQTFLDTAKRVIRAEAAALDRLERVLDDSLSQAANLLLNAKGRVIVSGMGKSGHIGRKIAATFASTGTPAHFVHPAEASHGDLGMLTKDDAALVLSTREDEPFGRTFAQISPLASLPSLMISIGRVPKATSSLLASIPSW